jgi:hypothetical protein
MHGEDRNIQIIYFVVNWFKEPVGIQQFFCTQLVLKFLFQSYSQRFHCAILSYSFQNTHNNELKKEYAQKCLILKYFLFSDFLSYNKANDIWGLQSTCIDVMSKNTLLKDKKL